MAERFDMVLSLGRLADEAAQRGDDRAAETLREAAKMLFADNALEESLSHRRASDAERQRRRRDRESRDVTLRHVTPRDGSEVFPHTPFPNSRVEDDDNTARARADDAVYAESVDNLISMLSDRVAEHWPDVDGFLKRRQFQTWKAWIKEMLSILTGGQALPCDLAQVCRDDGALERPIGSPKGLRTFVASATQDRLYPKEPVRPSRAAAAGNGKPDAGAAMFARIRGLVRSNPDPRLGTVQFIPIDEVKKLGDTAFRAYQSIGGAARVIATLKTPDKMVFLERDYAVAYARAEAEHVHA